MRDTRGRRIVRESAAAIAALAIAVLVVAHVTTTARAALLFTDGDSMLPLLVMRSLDVGQAQDWAMSSVLFLPELVVFRLLWEIGQWLRIGADAVIVLYGVVALMGLYGALRTAAGAVARVRAPITGALLAFTAFAVLASLDGTANRESLELASLMVTATYYGATVIAVVLSVALLARAPGRHPAAALTGVVLIAGVATLSNPLYLLWATAPLALVLAGMWLARRDARLLWGVLALVAGSIAGYGGRVPLAPFIANDGWGYADVTQAGASVQYYLGLVVERWQDPGGPAAVLLGVALFAIAAVCSARLRGRADRGPFLVATAGWVLPLVVVGAAILLGTHAARYLQPAMFAPVIALVTVPDAVRMPRPAAIARSTTVARVTAAAGLVIVVIAAATGIPTLVAAAHRSDPDLACVTSWVDRSGRVGGGQYWTIRLPKAHVADPRSLVQVDDAISPYDWLANRADAAPGAISFLVIDGQSPFYAPKVADALKTATIVPCGRYTIADFGTHPLTLGPPRS